MACSITSGYSIPCRDSVGGIKNVYILSGSISTINEESEGLINGVTGSGAFYKFELQKDTSDVTEVPTPSLANGSIFYEQTLNIQLHKLQSSIRNQVKTLGQNVDLKIVVETNVGEDSPYTGRYFLLGRRRGASLSAGSGASGTALGDANAYSLTFLAQEVEPMDEIKSTDGTLDSALSGISVS